MPRPVRFALISFLFLAFWLAVSPVFGTVKTVNISPAVLVVGQPITFSGVDIGTISPNSPENNVIMYIYPGFGCSYTPSNSIAFTIILVKSGNTFSGSYSTTLSFPVPVATSGQGYPGGWAVANQSYQNGLPAGSYSVSATDTQASTNGAAAICKNFTIVSSSPAAEFSDPVAVTCFTLASIMSLLLVYRRRQQISRM